VEASPKEATMEETLTRMQQDLAYAGYAQSTRESYLNAAKEMLTRIGRPVEGIGRDDLRAHVEHLRGQGKSASWLKMKLAAMVFLFTKTLGRPTEVSFVVWPKQHSPLPTVLSLEEVGAFLGALHHPVYRMIAMVLYGTGLRIAEALSLASRWRCRTWMARAAYSACGMGRVTGLGKRSCRRGCTSGFVRTGIESGLSGRTCSRLGGRAGLRRRKLCAPPSRRRRNR
jgi:integrase/recombinase XerD